MPNIVAVVLYLGDELFARLRWVAKDFDVAQGQSERGVDEPFSDVSRRQTMEKGHIVTGEGEKMPSC